MLLQFPRVLRACNCWVCFILGSFHCYGCAVLFYIKLSQTQNRAPLFNFPTTHSYKENACGRFCKGLGNVEGIFTASRHTTSNGVVTILVWGPQPFLEPKLQSTIMLLTLLVLSLCLFPFLYFLLLYSQEKYKDIKNFPMQSNSAVSSAKTNSKT